MRSHRCTLKNELSMSLVKTDIFFSAHAASGNGVVNTVIFQHSQSWCYNHETKSACLENDSLRTGDTQTIHVQERVAHAHELIRAIVKILLLISRQQSW